MMTNYKNCLLTFAFCLFSFILLAGSFDAAASELSEEFEYNNAAYRVLTPASQDSAGTVELVSYNGSKRVTSYIIKNISDEAGNAYDLVQIAPGAFYDARIGYLKLPDTVTEIGTAAFACSRIEEIDIPSGCSRIGDLAFYGSQLLEEIDIPAEVSYIGRGCFSYCSKLTDIFVDEDNLYYASYKQMLYSKDLTVLISGASAGKKVFIPDTVKVIDTYAFEGNSRIQLVYTPSGEYEIGDYAFLGCTSLKGFSFGPVTKIGTGAFSGCIKLKSVTLPATLTEIGSNPFAYCTGLTKITVDSDNTLFTGKGGCLYSSGRVTLLSAPAVSGAYTLDSKVKYIAAQAFAGNSLITSFTSTAKLKEIGEGAFYDCTSLSEVYFVKTPIALPEEPCDDISMAFGNTCYNIIFKMPYTEDTDSLSEFAKELKDNSPFDSSYIYLPD